MNLSEAAQRGRDGRCAWNSIYSPFSLLLYFTQLCGYINLSCNSNVGFTPAERLIIRWISNVIQ